MRWLLYILFALLAVPVYASDWDFGSTSGSNYDDIRYDMMGSIYTAGNSGTADSLSVKCYFTGGGGDARFALYEMSVDGADSTFSLIDTTRRSQHSDTDYVGAWMKAEWMLGGVITSGNEYLVVGTADATGNKYFVYDDAGSPGFDPGSYTTAWASSWNDTDLSETASHEIAFIVGGVDASGGGQIILIMGN